MCIKLLKLKSTWSFVYFEAILFYNIFRFYDELSTRFVIEPIRKLDFKLHTNYEKVIFYTLFLLYTSDDGTNTAYSEERKYGNISHKVPTSS